MWRIYSGRAYDQHLDRLTQKQFSIEVRAFTETMIQDDEMFDVTVRRREISRYSTFHSQKGPRRRLRSGLCICVYVCRSTTNRTAGGGYDGRSVIQTKSNQEFNYKAARLRWSVIRSFIGEYDHEREIRLTCSLSRTPAVRSRNKLEPLNYIYNFHSIYFSYNTRENYNRDDDNNRRTIGR